MKEKASILRNLFFVVVAGILITSCEKDKGPTPEENLIGTWTSGTSTFNTTINNQPILDYFNAQGLSEADAQLLINAFNSSLQQAFTGTITFNADKTYTTNLGGETDSGTWSLNDDADELTLDSNDGDPVVLDVETLTENQLVVSFDETGSQDLNEDLVPENIAVEVSLTFSKQ
jgi:hypothetical protein